MGIAVLASCAVAHATPAWDIAPGVSELMLMRDESVWVEIRGRNPSHPQGFQGFELYAYVSEGFIITGVLVDQPGAGTAFEGNSTGALIDFSSGQGAVAMVTTASGFVPDGSIVAKLRLTPSRVARLGFPYYLTTDGTAFWGAPSNFADGQIAIQDALRLFVVPESSVSLCFLLGLTQLMKVKRTRTRDAEHG